MANNNYAITNAGLNTAVAVAENLSSAQPQKTETTESKNTSSSSYTVNISKLGKHKTETSFKRTQIADETKFKSKQKQKATQFDRKQQVDLMAFKRQLQTQKNLIAVG